MAPFKVIVVGSGLAGSLVGNGLAKHGIDFQVYERNERNSKREGYQIRLGENALVGIRACLEPDHMRAVLKRFGRATSTASDAPVLYDTQFNKMLDLNQFPTYSKSAPISRVVLRDGLARPLDEAGRVHYGKKLLRFDIVEETSGAERVRVWFDDGTTDVCDVLVGADGNQSPVNRGLGLNNIERLDKFITCLTKCDLPLSTYQNLSPELLGSPIMTLAEGSFLYFGIYLPEKVNRSDNAKQAAYDEETANALLGFILPSDEMPKDFGSLPNHVQWDILAERFQNWSPKHREAIDLIRGHNIYSFTPRVGHQPPLDWRQKVATTEDPARGNPRVWLIGDAIHAMLPTRGMGGAQAMRDAADILPLLVELAETAKNSEGPLPRSTIQDACRRYEEAMIPRAYEWVKKSGGTSPMFVDMTRSRDRVFVTIVSYFLPLVQVVYSIMWTLRIMPPPNLNEALEFA